MSILNYSQSTSESKFQEIIVTDQAEKLTPKRLKLIKYLVIILRNCCSSWVSWMLFKGHSPPVLTCLLND